MSASVGRIRFNLYLIVECMTCAEIARDLGIQPTGLRAWVEQARINAGKTSRGAATSGALVTLPHSRRGACDASRIPVTRHLEQARRLSNTPRTLE